MKNSLFAILTAVGFLTATHISANNVIDVAEQDGIEQGIDLNDQNIDASFLGDLWGNIKDTASTIGGALSGAASTLKDKLSSAAATVKGIVSSAADLASLGFTAASDLAKKLGIENQLKEIPANVLQAGASAVESWLTNRANAIK